MIVLKRSVWKDCLDSKYVLMLRFQIRVVSDGEICKAQKLLSLCRTLISSAQALVESFTC